MLVLVTVVGGCTKTATQHADDPKPNPSTSSTHPPTLQGRVAFVRKGRELHVARVDGTQDVTLIATEYEPQERGSKMHVMYSVNVGDKTMHTFVSEENSPTSGIFNLSWTLDEHVRADVVFGNQSKTVEAHARGLGVRFAKGRAAGWIARLTQPAAASPIRPSLFDDIQVKDRRSLVVVDRQGASKTVWTSPSQNLEFARGVYGAQWSHDKAFIVFGFCEGAKDQQCSIHGVRADGSETFKITDGEHPRLEFGLNVE